MTPSVELRTCHLTDVKNRLLDSVGEEEGGMV